MATNGKIGVTTENIFPVIKKFLYSDHEIFLRELVANAVDATQKMKALAASGDYKGELGELAVRIELDESAKTLKIVDNGIGMTAEEVDKYINQIAFSSAGEFLENYKTAFALERLDYIRTIFDDNAVIIVGKVATVAPSPAAENQLTLNNKVITRTRISKEQYLKNLERCFASNEFVNIRFANNDIIKAGKGGEIYGIQIKQDYYSTNYGDTGYLFLMVDLNDPKHPVIKVRSWQPERDPNFGLVDLSHF